MREPVPRPTFGPINRGRYEGHVMCGPGALSIVTGKLVEVCNVKLRKKAGHRCLEDGAYTWALNEVLNEWGFITLRQQFSPGAQPTLRQWAGRIPINGYSYVLSVDGHFMAYRDGVLRQANLSPTVGYVEEHKLLIDEPVFSIIKLFSEEVSYE